ncbi:MAG TPA: right-handed parallel beta-helix repeat-containing protein [Acidimicrobiia bacterium]
MSRLGRIAATIGLVAATVAIPLINAPVAGALTTYTVTITGDVVEADGDLSLREAFTAANADGDDSVIDLGTGLAYTLDLCGVVPAHTSNSAGSVVHTAADDLTVYGHGSTVIQTCPDERVMRNSSAMATITLEDVTLTGGQVTETETGPDGEPIGGGGGLRSDGPAFLDDVVITGNTAVESGGGLRALVETTITGGSIDGNTATSGAGGADIGSGFAAATPILTMAGGTVTMNGPVGVFLRFGSNTITDSTVTDNTGHGIFADHGNHTIDGTTVSGNGGGGMVAIDGHVTLVDATVEDNDDVGVTTTGAGDFTVTGGSVVGNGSHGIDFIGCNASEGQDNIVLDGASVTGNGEWGINHGGCGNTVVSGGSDISGNAGGVRCSTCEFVTIEDSTVDGNTTFGGVDFRPGWEGAGGDLFVRNSQITDNTSQNDGGGIRARQSLDEDVDTTVTVSNSSNVTGNSTTGNGGGIYAEGDAIVFGSTVSFNSTTGTFEDPGGEGGGLYVQDGDLSVSGGAVEGNVADNNGGGISHRGAGGFSLGVFGTAITGNDASGVGGGIFTWSSASFTVVAADVSGNTSIAQGAGIGALDTAGIVALSTIDGNQASAVGGGIYYDDGVLPGDPLIIFETTISNNTAPAGGGVFADIRPPAGVEVISSTVSGNTGSGIQTSLTTPITLDSTTVVDNGPSNVVTAVGGLLTTTQSVIALADGGSDCLVSLATSHGYNFSGDGTCGLGLGAGDVSFGGDPVLGALADNGGPTETHEPQSGSPLLSMVPSASCSQPEDQRGETRPGGTGCEPGSVEVGISLALPDELTTLPGFPEVIDVLGALPPGIFDPATLRILVAPTGGRAAADTDEGVIRYTAGLDFEGMDRLEYEICRATDPETCEQAVLEIEVTLGVADACTIVGTNKSEVIVGTSGDDVICARGGNDVVLGRGGNDLIIGGNGHDLLHGNRGYDQLVGGSGFDGCWVGHGGGITARCEFPKHRPT